MIATAATATVALTQTKNVTYALETQVQIGDNMDVCLNMLEAVIISLGYELDDTKYQQRLLC
jgi:hypothetical protein